MLNNFPVTLPLSSHHSILYKSGITHHHLLNWISRIIIVLTVYPALSWWVGADESTSGDEAEGEGEGEGEGSHEKEGIVEETAASTSHAVEGSETKAVPECPVVTQASDEGKNFSPMCHAMLCIVMSSYVLTYFSPLSNWSHYHHILMHLYHLKIISSFLHVHSFTSCCLLSNLTACSTC